MSVKAVPSPAALSPSGGTYLLQARPAETCRVASHDGDDTAIVDSTARGAADAFVALE